MTYYFSPNTTEITYFYGDMHTYSIRADKVLNNRADMMEVVKRFEADKSQFDYTDYFSTAEFHKANREYTVLVVREVSYDEIVFSFDGKEFKTTTKKWSVISKIEKNADKIISHKQVFATALVDDATGDTVAIHKVNRTLDKSKFEDFLPF